jgi:predicted membrane-bound spermidine synthase
VSITSLSPLDRAVLFALVFCGGFANLATEIIGPRLFSSLFGNTTIVWAILISVTLVGLSVGYVLGGRVRRDQVRRALPALLIVNALWLLAVSWIVWEVPASASASGVTIDSGVILTTAGAAFFVPSVLFGMLSPMAIALLTSDRPSEAISEIVGNIYALSTLGSVLGALTAAYVWIPWIGLSASLRIFALGLVIFAAYFAAPSRRSLAAAALIACLIAPQPGYRWRDDDGLELIAQREGYYQTIRVYGDGSTFVQMHLGPTFHSRMSLITGEPTFSYAERILALIDDDLTGRRALVIGGAGHAIARSLERRGAEVVEVEIDPLVRELSDQHFGPIGGEVVIADGRVYLARAAEASFDLVIVDAFDGAANVPPQLTTLEFFEAVDRVLRPGGRMLYNFIGTPEGPRSRSFHAMSATLRAAFDFTGGDYEPGITSRNILLAASPDPLDDLPLRDLPADGLLLTDDRNPIEILLSEARTFYYFRR